MWQVKWLARKEIDYEKVDKYIQVSLRLNQFTNGGPNVKRLEDLLRSLLKVDDERSIIVVNNGAAALHALASAISLEEKKSIRWASQSYTFPSVVQGSLIGTLLVDIGPDVGPDLSQIPPEIDGIIVTNVLGHLSDLSKYERWAVENSKYLLFDCAATSYSFYRGRNSINYGTGSIISFHHTKPIGFGEGGAIIVEKRYEAAVRKIINFGYDMVKLDQIWLPEGNNYKMSDLSSIYILQYLEQFPGIVETHRRIYQRFLEGLKRIPNVTPFPNFSDEIPFVSCMPVIFSQPQRLEKFVDKGIEVKKYYKPLDLSHPRAVDLYNRIICFPCNKDMTEGIVDWILDEIRKVTDMKDEEKKVEERKVE